MLRACISLSKSFSGLSVNPQATRISPTIVSNIPVIHSSRSMSGFFKHGDAQPLWKSMAGVSAQGKKRGRQKQTLRQKNLNKGQRIGFGKARISWPGLTAKTLVGAGKASRPSEIGEMDEKVYTSYQEELAETIKNSQYGGFRRRVDPLERGWTSAKAHGRKFGAPEAANKELEFENFDSILLEFKTVFHMTGNLGRVRRLD